MVAVCPNLLASGSCSDPSCKRRHDTVACDICRRLFRSTEAYQNHCSSKKHLRQVNGSLVYCSVCEINISQGSWNSHLSGSPHRNRATRQGVTAYIEKEPPVSDPQPGITFCTICHQQFPDRLWAKHLASPSHTRKSRFVAFQGVVAESEKDKHGIEVGGSFDFDIVEPAAAAAGVTLSINIRNTIPISKINLREMSLNSKKGKGHHSPFVVSAAEALVAIKFGQPVTVKVTLRQAYNGVCEDRLEMVFEDASLNKRFIISKRLSAVVGARDEIERLRPSAPYVPRQRTSRLVEREVVQGVFPPALRAIPYIGKLPEAPIPSQLAATLSSGTQQEIIRNIQKIYLPRTFDSESYGRFFKTLLWIEEYRMEKDLEIYDIPAATLTPHHPYYYLRVPGLAEKRPSVLVGDRILVQEDGAPEGRWYEGGVFKVTRDEVALRFNASFKHRPDQTYHVHFKLNRYPLRRQHLAMDTAFSSDRILFPTQAHSLPGGRPQALQFRNALIANNPAQALAVKSIANLPPGAPPFIVFGPPGTGKTVTMVEAIRQVLARNPTSRVLACAPSNSAAALIALQLADLGKETVFRFYAPSRSKNQVPDELHPFICLKDDQHFSVPPIPTMKRFRVVVATCVSASVVSGIGIARGHYSHIFIDEAGQATEPETMVSIKTMADNNTNIVLSGDPKQLGPIIRSGIARAFKLDISYLERIMDREAYGSGLNASIVKLTMNFRSHEAILKYPNERFYGGELQQCGDLSVIRSYLGSELLPAKRFPIIFHSISGKDDREASSPSFFNVHEALQVKAYVEALRSNRKVRITDHDIGVITPYHAQVLRIRRSLDQVADAVKVGSVEEFQGQERHAIIISTVRSSREFVEYDLRHTLGFVANPRRFNVAVTRAKALLIIIGDPAVLSLDPLWRSFLNYIHTNGGWKGPPPTWDTSEVVDEAGGYDAQARQMAVDDMNDFTARMEELTIAGAASGDGNAEAVEAGVDKPWRDME